jgi:predicted flavoprotein YhiN
MMAAIAAAAAGRRAVIVEQLDRPGVKLLATGGGRCNLTNSLDVKDFLHRFGRRGAFLRHAITELDSEGLREFFGGLGVETVTEEGGGVYPATHSAASVQQALVKECRRLGAEFLYGAEAKEVLVAGGAAAGLATSAGEIAAPRVILAAGGRSYSELGGTGGGYALARRAGHSIVEPTPALVDLHTKETWPAGCAGIGVIGARVWMDLSAGAPGGEARSASAKRQAFPGAPGRADIIGDVLFTHEGLSGPAILDISGNVVEMLRSFHEVPFRLSLWPGTTAQDWRIRLDRWRESHGRRAVAGLLAIHMPERLADALCALAGVGPQTTAAHLDSRQRHALAEVLASVPLTANGSGGFAKAMVTRGGVGLKEVEGRTMESKLVKGLFFAGEVLDVDGPCGGFNLQWAFSSGRLAGASASR